MSQAMPVRQTDRLETLDVLRGFALLGILAMNIRAMAAPFGSYMYPFGLFEFTGANRAAFIFTSAVFDLKMMGLFSMLFGVSVLLYAAKPTESVRALRTLWFRRMFWLLVIGLVHAYLIWNGDILVPYAMCGLLLLWWVRRLSAVALVNVAGALLLVGALLSIGHGIAWESMSDAERAQEIGMWMPSAEQSRTALDAMLGGYVDVVRHRAPDALMFQTFLFVVFFFWRCAGMMLLGMGLYKSGFLDGRLTARTYALVAALCLPSGLALAWYGALELERIGYGMPGRTAIDLWNYTGAILASVGYAAAIVLVVKRGVFAAVRRALAAVGQMALTNYLLQSVITAVLFLGWGFGFAGRLDYAGQLLVVAAIWLVQLAASAAWMARYRFGPAEWFWRSLTYWTRQPIRRDPT
ncbi:MAG: DUF418 domain-containing protein, partial [Acidobacteriota bacterium]